MGSVVRLLIVVISAWALAPARAVPLFQGADMPLRSAADLAVGLAQSGHPAGMVITLPAPLEVTLAREQSRPNAFLINRSPFGVWIRNEVSAANEIPSLSTDAQAEAAVAGFAVRSGLQIAKWRNTPTYLLKSPSAATCAARLRTPLASAAVNRNLVELVASAIRVATSAKVPGGFVGSCVGVADYAAEPVQLAAGETLEDALSHAVNTFGSAVWVVVQDGGANCSVGLIRRAESGGACKTAITSTLNPTR